MSRVMVRTVGSEGGSKQMPLVNEILGAALVVRDTDGNLWLFEVTEVKSGQIEVTSAPMAQLDVINGPPRFMPLEDPTVSLSVEAQNLRVTKTEPVDLPRELPELQDLGVRLPGLAYRALPSGREDTDEE